MTTRYADHVIGGDHASRPAATAVPEGTTYSCTDHALEYQSDGATWSTRSTFGTAGAYTAGGTDVAVADGGTGASTAPAARTNLGVGTGDSPEFAALNVGAATDTTITRTGAGEIAVEGNRIFRVGGADVPIADGGTGASTATAAFDALSPMTTAGDLIVGGASGTRTRLGVGSNGEILTLVAGTPSWEPNTGVADILDLPTAETDDTLVLAPDGAGGVEFRAEAGGGGGSGALVFLEAHTASASASLDFTSFISSTYDTYKIEVVELKLATDGAHLHIEMGTGGGPTYDTGNTYEWARFGLTSGGSGANDSGASGLARLFNAITNAAGYGFGTASLTATGLQSTSLRKTIQGTIEYANTAPAAIYAIWGMQWTTTGTAVTGLRFIASSGNITSGTIRIYGVAKS